VLAGIEALASSYTTGEPAHAIGAFLAKKNRKA
jgi:hypothetical protein